MIVVVLETRRWRRNGLLLNMLVADHDGRALDRISVIEAPYYHRLCIMLSQRLLSTYQWYSSSWNNATYSLGTSNAKPQKHGFRLYWQRWQQTAGKLQRRFPSSVIIFYLCIGSIQRTTKVAKQHLCCVAMVCYLWGYRHVGSPGVPLGIIFWTFDQENCSCVEWDRLYLGDSHSITWIYVLLGTQLRDFWHLRSDIAFPWPWKIFQA